VKNKIKVNLAHGVPGGGGKKETHYTLGAKYYTRKYQGGFESEGCGYKLKRVNKFNLSGDKGMARGKKAGEQKKRSM